MRASRSLWLSKPTGTSREIWLNTFRSDASSSSFAVSDRRRAIMPQPMSTPTAAGMIALLRRNHRADRGADAQMHVGHRRDVVVHDRQLRDVDELQPRRRLDLAGVDLHRHEAFVDFGADGHD